MKVRYMFAALAAVLLLCGAAGCGSTSLPKERPEEFSFSLVWGVHGISSYDSATGQLVKSRLGGPLVTGYEMSAEELDRVYAIIRELNVENYPDIYDPHKGRMSAPSMTIVLTVRAGAVEKTVAAENIYLSYDAQSAEGQRFLDAVKDISTILSETEEWQSLPEVNYYLFE